MRAIYVDRELLRRYGHSKLSKMAAAAVRIENSAIRSVVPENPIYNKHEVDRTTGCGNMAI